MKTQSRMTAMFASRSRKLAAAGLVGVLVLGVVLAIASSRQATPSADEPTHPDDAGPPPKPVHEMDPSRHTIPAGPVTGVVCGVDVTAEVVVEGDSLVLRTPVTGEAAPDRKVSLQLGATAAAFVNRKLTVHPGTPPGPNVPAIFVEATGLPRPEFHAQGYALTLELGARNGGKLPGRIYLCLPDEKRTVLAGTFTADFPRLPTDPPEADDVPFINGTITLRNAPAKTVVRTGYIGITGPSPILGAGDIDIDPTLPAERAAQFIWDKPRVTGLVVNKDAPIRYEHSKLSPGRYLVFAALPKGPVVWKWLTLSATSTETVDFTLDPTQCGGLEVSAPLEALGKVQLAPLPEPAIIKLDSTMFYAVALHLRLEEDIVARKALFRNLAPGKYEVRAGGQIRVVEIVAGKVMELDFDRKPSEPK